MKTTLLKRLRNKAKKHDYYIDLEFFDQYITAVSCKDIEAAKQACNTARRKYILNEVRSMRNKNYEILDF